VPAKSERQRRLFGMALGLKRRGGFSRASGTAARLARTMSTEQLRDFAKKRKKKV